MYILGLAQDHSAVQIAITVGRMAEAGLYHKDISPANILPEPQLLIDFQTLGKAQVRRCSLLPSTESFALEHAQCTVLSAGGQHLDKTFKAESVSMVCRHLA